MQEAASDETGLNPSGVLDTSPAHEAVTDGAAERGIFNIVGGYVDPDGNVHNEVQLRAMTGHEEDLLGSKAGSFTQRMTAIMTACTQRIGDFVDRGAVARAINALPSGSRTHLLICLRRTTHWRSTKDIYDMQIKCPECNKHTHYAINLSEIETFEMKDPKKHIYTFTLPERGSVIEWEVLKAPQDQVVSVVASDVQTESSILTFGTALRIRSIDGVRYPFDLQGWLTPNHDKLKLGKNESTLYNAVKGWTSGDRDAIRAEFFDNEPSIDTDVEISCPECKETLSTRLEVGQSSFFFPQATRMRSKRTAST